MSIDCYKTHCTDSRQTSEGYEWIQLTREFRDHTKFEESNTGVDAKLIRDIIACAERGLKRLKESKVPIQAYDSTMFLSDERDIAEYLRTFDRELNKSNYFLPDSNILKDKKRELDISEDNDREDTCTRCADYSRRGIKRRYTSDTDPIFSETQNVLSGRTSAYYSHDGIFTDHRLHDRGYPTGLLPVQNEDSIGIGDSAYHEYLTTLHTRQNTTSGVQSGFEDAVAYNTALDAVSLPSQDENKLCDGEKAQDSPYETVQGSQSAHDNGLDGLSFQKSQEDIGQDDDIVSSIWDELNSQFTSNEDASENKDTAGDEELSTPGVDRETQRILDEYFGTDGSVSQETHTLDEINSVTDFWDLSTLVN